MTDRQTRKVKIRVAKAERSRTKSLMQKTKANALQVVCSPISNGAAAHQAGETGDCVAATRLDVRLHGTSYLVAQSPDFNPVDY